MNAPPSFDRVARIYRWAEYLALGPLLQATRIHFLPRVAHCRQALVLGDGDGRFLVRLLQQSPHLQALAVDTSGKMLRLLRQRCKGAGDRLQTQQTSALTAVMSIGTDLVVTHFFLDCLTQPEVDTLASRIAASLEPNALWLLSDFRIPPHGFLHYIASAYIRLLYFAFRILTGLRVTHLPAPASALAQAGFRRVAQHQSLGGILYTELWQL